MICEQMHASEQLAGKQAKSKNTPNLGENLEQGAGHTFLQSIVVSCLLPTKIFHKSLANCRCDWRILYIHRACKCFQILQVAGRCELQITLP